MMLRVGCEMVKSPEALERRRLHALEYEQRKRDEQKKSKTTRAKGDPLPTSPILKGKNGGGDNPTSPILKGKNGGGDNPTSPILTPTAQYAAGQASENGGGARADLKAVPVAPLRPLPPFKLRELARIDKAVVMAYRQALKDENSNEAEFIRHNPLNSRIDWDVVTAEELCDAKEDQLLEVQE